MRLLYFGLLCITLSTCSVHTAAAPGRTPARISQMRQLQERNAGTCQDELKRYQDVLDKCSTKTEKLENELETSKLENDALAKENVQLNERIRALEKSLNKQQTEAVVIPPEDSKGTRNKETEAFGFTYELSSTMSLSHNVPITFDSKLFDSSDSSIVPQLGTFTCPDSDYYMFYWSVHASKRRVSAKLVMEGETVKPGPLTTDLADNYSGTSTMASIVQCEEGSSIWVAANAWPEQSECNQIEGFYSSFSGFKLYAQSDDSVEAMTAQLSANTTATVVPYDEILFSEGENYDPETGSFVCSSDGVYVIVVSVHYVTSVSDFYIQRNGARVRYLTLPRNTLSGTSTDSGTSTATCVLTCQRDDVITVRSSGTRDHLASMSSFTAFRLAQRENETMAFTAGLTSSNLDYFDGQTIVFDDVNTNVGGFYFPNIGSFVCPDNELYLFSWQVSVVSESNNRPGELRLMMGGETVKTGPRTEEVLAGSGSSTSSTQVIVKCEFQTAVYIKMVVPDGGSQTLYRAYTSFSGLRLPKV